MAEYKATSEQWAKCEADAKNWSGSYECILELRARVEALEARQRPASKVYEISKPLQLTPEQAQQINDLLAPNSKSTPNSSQIRSSLVDRVAKALYDAPTTHEGWRSEARAAIREVAAWMREQHDGDLAAATVLEREAER